MVGALSQIARLLMVAPRDFPYCESANVYTAVGDVLLDWPGALHTAFQEFASERLPFARFYPRHQGDLDVADVMVTELEKYKHWSVKASDTVRNFLSEEMWRCIGTVAPYLAAADKNIRRMSATPPSAQEWIPLGVAAKRLNMQCQTFNDLLASGAVEFKTETRGKLTRKLVKAASLTPDLRRDRMIGVRELNRITGLPVSTLEYLKASGDLPKNYKGPGSGFMAIQDLKTFEDRWSKIAVSKCPKGVETTDLHSAFRWTQGYGNDIAWKAEVVRRLLKGELKAFKVITKPTLNATLETAAVHAVRSEFVSHRMSFGDASDFLALERIGVMQLAVAGKLTPIFEGSTVLFSISELEEFKEAYVSLSRLSHSIEKGAVLATICRDNGIETLSVLGRRGPVVYVPKEAAKSIHAPRRARVAEC